MSAYLRLFLGVKLFVDPLTEQKLTVGKHVTDRGKLSRHAAVRNCRAKEASCHRAAGVA